MSSCSEYSSISSDYCRRRQLPASAYFLDNARRIDFVLAYDPKAGGRKKRAEFQQFRRKFEELLENEGLELEHERSSDDDPLGVGFVKVHAPWAALARQAELLKIQIPVMASDLPKTDTWIERWLGMHDFLGNLQALQPELQLPRAEYFTDSFERHRVDEFLIEDPETYFKPATRIYLTWTIISNITLSQEKTRTSRQVARTAAADMATVNPHVENISGRPMQTQAVSDLKRYTKTANVEYLVKQGIYKAVYPIHDSAIDEAVDKDATARQWPMRKYLYEAWARPRQWFKVQPIEEIRDYYGVQMAMYFAFLGFYTRMLLPAAAIGVLVTVFAIVTTAVDSRLELFCNSPSNLSKNTFVICRECPSNTCPFIKAGKNLCFDAVSAGLFDNLSATFYALFMAIWGVLFINIWQRYQSALCQRWDIDMDTIQHSNPRPEFICKAKSVRINPATKLPEPCVSLGSKICRRMISYSILLLFISIVLGLLCVVIGYYRAGPVMWARVFHYQDESGNDRVDVSTSLIVSLTASLINGLFVAIMQRIFTLVSWKLTELELPRTDEEFEKSHTYKTVLFQFVNYYGALFYLSFIRGQWPDAPNSNRGVGKCPPIGCLLEVAVQLMIIMIGKQAINNLVEIGLPFLRNLRRLHKQESADVYTAYQVAEKRWEADLKLDENPPLQHFNDYLEMVIQHGFVTFFVAAFPLAPLFALLNNAVEIRIDAAKNLIYSRRCIPTRPKDIGPWFTVLTIMSKVAVLTNAALIAFNTDGMERFVHYMMRDHDGHTHNDAFIRFSMSIFHTEDWCTDSNKYYDGTNCHALTHVYRSNGTPHHVQTCYYRGHMQRNEQTHIYELSMIFYLVMAARLGFILCFEHSVSLAQTLINRFTPDVPTQVRIRLEREAHLQRQAFKQNEYIEAAEAALEDVETVMGGDVENPWEIDFEEELERAREAKRARQIADNETQLSVFGRVHVCMQTLSSATGRFFKQITE